MSMSIFTLGSAVPSIRAGKFLNRGLVLAAVLIGMVPALVSPAIAADAWPSKTVRMIVPFAPGGPADSSARVLTDVMSPQMGTPMIVENKPGAGSILGVTSAVQSKDGHTLLMGSNSMVINPSLMPNVTYDVARDFDAIGMVSSQPLVLVVPSSSNIKSVADLIAEAKAHPGDLSAGNSGNGTMAHLAAEIFAAQTGTSLMTVPYKGESALLPDLISGIVSTGFLNLPSVLPHVKAGRLRALAVSSPQSVVDLPDVPTFRSLKLPSLELLAWAVLVAPKGTIPPEGLTKLEGLLSKALTSEVVQKRFASMGLTPMILGREATANFLKAEGARYAEVIKSRGIKAN